MTLQQLEYIVAVNQQRHFARAAEQCHVTQPTLSMMIRRLESELDIQIFDRSRQPVVPTAAGEAIILQASRVLQEAGLLRELVYKEKGVVAGNLSLGVIPTLAPYLIPRFVRTFLKAHPKVRLKVNELRTEDIIEQLKRGALDAAILVTPLDESGLHEEPLFFEEFYVYSSVPYEKAYLLPEDLNPNELWLLEEGHCFRSQILNLCELRRKAVSEFAYEAGSIETLKRLVEHQQGITILPELAVSEMNDVEKARLRPFQPPAPVREVSLVTHRPYLKQNILSALRETIQAAVPGHMLERSDAQILSV